MSARQGSRTKPFATVADLRRLMAGMDGGMKVYFDDGHTAYRVEQATVMAADYDGGRLILQLEQREEQP